MAAQLLRAAAEDLCGRRVGRVDVALLVEHQHADRGGLDQAAQQLFAVAQGAALALELGDHVVEALRQLADGVVVGGVGAGQAVAGGEGVGYRTECSQAPPGLAPPKQAEQAAERQQERGEQGERAEQLGKMHGQTGPAGKRVTLAERVARDKPG
ncbi:hypothetical protein D3C81_1632490 [compost metagenome]